jgi:hypothetical protein
MNIRQITNPEYPVVDSLTIESIVDGKSLDESRTIFSHPLAIFAFLLK